MMHPAPMRARSVALALFLSLSVGSVGASGLAGCGGSARDSGGKVEYSVSARQNYERGMRRLKDEDHAEAAKLFAFVKARFPYSKYAVLAELRLADTLFASGAYLEAIDAYRLFIRFHPTHEMVANGYASFRIAEAYVKTMPEDWFLIPPSHEMDATATADALRELDSFLRRFPDSPFRARGVKMREKVARRLAAHEWYVARFYWKRDRPMGTVLRLRTLLTRYPGVGYDQQALHLLGKAWLKVGKRDEARKAWQRLVTEHPNHALTGEAKEELGRLGGG